MNSLARARTILALDGGPGLGVGLVVLALYRILTDWFGLPSEIVLLIGLANLVYGLYSGSLALFVHFKGRPPRRFFVNFLIAANLAWSLVCVWLLATYWPSIRWLGMLHVGLEGCFVVFLAVLEFRVLRPLTA